MLDLRTDEDLSAGILEYSKDIHKYDGGAGVAAKLRRELEKRQKVWSDVNSGRAARTSPSGLWR